MKFSVITVCFNSAATLMRAIGSVHSQSWPEVEHIVIDGGSTDGSQEILELHRKNFTHLLIEPDKGIYDAMNKGLIRASGDVVCFLNADDMYSDPFVLARVATRMQANDLDALMGDVGFFHRDNPGKLVRRYRSDRFTPSRLAWGWMPAHPGLFLHQRVVRRVGYFKSDYRIAGDFDFIVRAFHGSHLKYEHLAEVLVLMQTGGISTNGLASKIILNREMLRACKENGLDTNIFKIISRYPLKLLELLQVRL